MGVAILVDSLERFPKTITDGDRETEVEMSTTVIGVMVKHSGSDLESKHRGSGALVRVIRDGPPHRKKIAVAAGGGDMVREEVIHSVGSRRKAHTTACRDASRVLEVT